MDVTDATFQDDVWPAAPRCRSSWTSGPPGAGPAPRSAPCSNGPWPPPMVPLNWPKSTWTRTRASPSPSGCKSIPAVFAIRGRQGGRPVHRRPARSPGHRVRPEAAAGPERGRSAGGRGRRGLPAPGARARGRAPRSHRGPGPDPDRPGRAGRGARPAGQGARDARHPGAGGRGPTAGERHERGRDRRR